VFIGLPVTSPPGVELAERQSQPQDQQPHGDFGSLTPVIDEIDDLVARSLSTKRLFKTLLSPSQSNAFDRSSLAPFESSTMLTRTRQLSISVIGSRVEVDGEHHQTHEGNQLRRVARSRAASHVREPRRTVDQG
jgi:hypothetical protein